MAGENPTLWVTWFGVVLSLLALVGSTYCLWKGGPTRREMLTQVEQLRDENHVFAKAVGDQLEQFGGREAQRAAAWAALQDEFTGWLERLETKRRSAASAASRARPAEPEAVSPGEERAARKAAVRAATGGVH